MKALVFLLLFPVVAFGNSYNYSKVISLNVGSDNFAFDHVKTSEHSGAIEFNGNELMIDGKKFELKADENPNKFKAKKCSFELVYKAGELAMVKLYKANQVICYVMQPGVMITKK